MVLRKQFSVVPVVVRVVEFPATVLLALLCSYLILRSGG